MQTDFTVISRKNKMLTGRRAKSETVVGNGHGASRSLLVRHARTGCRSGLGTKTDEAAAAGIAVRNPQNTEESHLVVN
jgi:hypothetical protein